MHSSRVTMGTDYPFPLGDLEIGKFIEEMPLEKCVKDDIFHQATLAWLDIPRERFT
jgi:aminocarboxymuconate-semialdehyde decarboxylase